MWLRLEQSSSERTSFQRFARSKDERNEPMTSAVAVSKGPPCGSVTHRVLALVEVLVVFALVHLSYRSFKHFTELGRWEVTARLNFSTGSVMILFPVIVLVLGRRSFREYGLTEQGWRYNLNVGLFWGILVIAVAGLIVKFTPIQFNPLTPPDWKRALAASAGTLVLTLLLLIFLAQEGAARSHSPVGQSTYTPGAALAPRDDGVMVSPAPAA